MRVLFHTTAGKVDCFEVNLLLGCVSRAAPERCNGGIALLLGWAASFPLRAQGTPCSGH